MYLVDDSQVARSSGKRYIDIVSRDDRYRAIRNRIRMPSRAFHNVIRIHRSIEDFCTRDEGFSIQILSLFLSVSCVCKLPFIDPSNGITACLSSRMKGIAVVRRQADTIFVLYAIDP